MKTKKVFGHFMVNQKKNHSFMTKTSEMYSYSSLWNSMFSYIISNMLCSNSSRFCINFPSNSMSNTQSSIRNSQTDKNSPQTLCNVVQLHHGSKIQPNSAGLLRSLWSMGITVLAAIAEDILPYYIASYASHEYITE